MRSFEQGLRPDTHPALELLADEGLEHGPHHVEEEGLLDDVHLLEPERHRLLDEVEQAHGEGGREARHLLHAEALEVEDDDDARHLRLGLEHGGQVDQVEYPEDRVCADFLGIPGGCNTKHAVRQGSPSHIRLFPNPTVVVSSRTSALVDEDPTAVLVAVDEHVDDVRVEHGIFLRLGLQAVEQSAVVLLELERALDLQTQTSTKIKSAIKNSRYNWTGHELRTKDPDPYRVLAVIRT
ncbi:hypothetical protein FOCC_FOCC007603 [Frankliniella occidentalis]|nr:hypothetical protein FOCC_FOCC007603 [Frankliniella occidentalis]